MNIDCLIPAAGLSSRMGRWKLMLPYNDRTILETSVSNALSLCSRVILVTGYNGEKLESLFKPDSRVITIRNSSYERGMFSSIQTGVKMVKTDWFFITMGDMPDIGADLYLKLIDTVKANTGIEIVRPLFNGKRGHPVLLNRTVIKTILSEPPESEMRNVFTSHKVLDLPLDLPESFYDIDTEEDYRKAAGRS